MTRSASATESDVGRVAVDLEVRDVYGLPPSSTCSVSGLPWDGSSMKETRATEHSDRVALRQPLEAKLSAATRQ